MRKRILTDLQSGRIITAGEKRFYIELNHLMPVSLKKEGYEIIRTEEISEISERVVVKFTRAIHARYLRNYCQSGIRSGRQQRDTDLRY